LVCVDRGVAAIDQRTPCSADRSSNSRSLTAIVMGSSDEAKGLSPLSAAFTRPMLAASAMQTPQLAGLYLFIDTEKLIEFTWLYLSAKKLFNSSK